MDDKLVTDVEEELRYDPRTNSETIAVAASDGVVTLRGTVGSFRQKLAAKRAVSRVKGVKKVENDLQVRLLSSYAKKGDAELRAEVLQALELNDAVPETIDVRVDHSYVTLTGTAEWQFQRELAVRVAGSVRGVFGVTNAIELSSPTPDLRRVTYSIKNALERNARIEDDDIKVTSSDGAVTLDGVVSSWAEHDAAIGAAWGAPGVKNVHDHLEVLSD